MGRIVTAGHLNWDVTLRVDSLPTADGEAKITSQRQSGGGSAANVASALAGFSVPTALIASVGDDHHGRLARQELEEAGVGLDGLRTIEGGATTVKYIIVDEAGEVMVLANEGVNEAIGPEDIDDGALADADHLHLTSQRPETAARLVDLANDQGVSVSFDPGRRLGDREYDPLYDQVEYLFLNEQEAVEALPTEEDTLGEVVSGTDRVIVVKHGAEGASVFTPGATYEHPGFGVDPVDTTGAGDAFAAGFLAVVVGGMELDGADEAVLESETDYERALEIGNACGALAACEEGARTAPTRDALAEFLAEQYRAI